MRDPKRIDEICELLKQVWTQVPDWRLCQLIVNCVGTTDPFYIEDDAVIAIFKTWLEKANSTKRQDDE